MQMLYIKIVQFKKITLYTLLGFWLEICVVMTCKVADVVDQFTYMVDAPMQVIIPLHYWLSFQEVQMHLWMNSWNLVVQI